MRRTYFRASAVGAFLLALARPCEAADEAPEGFRAPSYRLAFTPTWTHAFAAHSVSHDALGLTSEIFLGRRMGIALVGALYSPFQDSHANAPSSFPLNETLGSVFPEVRITLLRGERAELAVVAGAGVLASRPVSLVDPENRRFEYRAHFMSSAGAVARVFLSRDLALSIDARNAVYIETREDDGIWESARRDPSTWYGDSRLMNVLEARVGLAMFLWEK
jgi:hypothetical protein